MATSVRFTSIAASPIPADLCGLEPAPSVKDWYHITKGLKGVQTIEDVNDLLKGTHDIQGDYRGWTMWLYPNVRIYRSNPKSCGGNGFAGCPTSGTKETVTVRIDDQVYDAVVEFV